MSPSHTQTLFICVREIHKEKQMLFSRLFRSPPPKDEGLPWWLWITFGVAVGSAPFILPPMFYNDEETIEGPKKGPEAPLTDKKAPVAPQADKKVGEKD